MTKVSSSIIINAPQEDVFSVIADFESYPDFLPEVEEATVEKASGNEVVASFTMNMMARINLTLKFKLKKPNTISWSLVEGQMLKKNDGSWKLNKVSAKKTEAVYSVDVGFGMFVPESIGKTLMEKNLPRMMKNFKRRIEKMC